MYFFILTVFEPLMDNMPLMYQIKNFYENDSYNAQNQTHMDIILLRLNTLSNTSDNIYFLLAHSIRFEC